MKIFQYCKVHLADKLKDILDRRASRRAAVEKHVAVPLAVAARSLTLSFPRVPLFGDYQLTHPILRNHILSAAVCMKILAFYISVLSAIDFSYTMDLDDNKAHDAEFRLAARFRWIGGLLLALSVLFGYAAILMSWWLFTMLRLMISAFAVFAYGFRAPFSGGA
ncbi:hypothetical protein Droror1_Dr00024002 [Drosera rotundifolia]